MGMSNIDKTSEFAETRSDQREHPKEVATCRHCKKVLRGEPYYKGGRAYLPDGGQAPSNYYGGFVCSRSCDYRASLSLEQSMPGHNGQERLSPNSEALRRVNSNWPDGV